MYYNPKERECVIIVLKIKHFSGNLIILFLLKMYYWGWKLLTYRVKKSWLVPSNLFIMSINWIDNFYYLWSTIDHNVLSHIPQQPGQPKLHVVKIPTQHQWIGPLLSLWRLLVCSNNILFIQSKFKKEDNLLA